ncbi:MipA/OmpV family protein [Erythrobacter dokdonensis]|uniref:MltA-interacting MipA n=1 Tax=Erythrobacter dokdonensis DSW-74 TaxID=1300349 RepID=A0A1A7BIU9_9SPHN|nr:MipA/OmpV family protein [Erythrobacter dokdonensis]OBV11636.1 MltA-interacting MipA [Erythrobacter dokdonensis DSW-74]
MKPFIKPMSVVSPIAPCVGALLLGASPALAGETEAEDSLAADAAAAATGAEASTATVQSGQAQGGPQGQQAGAPAGMPPGGPPFKTVFDKNWITVGLGAGLVPTYAGSDNFQFFPLPLVVGRVGGVGIRPSAAGLTLDFLSPQPTLVSRKKKPTVSLGPTFRFRNDRAVDSGDDVVNAAGRLDNALEVGVNAGLSFPGVFNRLDSLTVSANVRWDVLGAHEGRVIEPGVTYATPIGRGMLVQVGATAEFIDDNFADYYFSVSPAQSAASGLPVFSADGGLNRIGTLAIVTVDLDGNALNGGLNVYGLTGYSRMLGDGADNPYTALRGDPNQFLVGLGLGYTF